MILYPNAYVNLLTGVPLDDRYTDTILFSTLDAQSTYFKARIKAGYSYNDFTYQRWDPRIGKKAAIRVPEVADNLYDVNYIAFRNNNFGTKWFYAFVKAINFINPGVTEIEYEIDVLQTWMFDFKVGRSFVAREHVSNDTVGMHTQPEGLDTGQYLMGPPVTTGVLNPKEDYSIGVACTFDQELNPAVGYISGDVYNGLKILSMGTADEVNDFLATAADDNKASGIVSIFMLPTILVANREAPNGYLSSVILDKDVSGSFKYVQQAGGYTPKNKKLYTYPYNFLYVTNYNSTPGSFRYEFFDTPNCRFGLHGAVSPNPEFLLIPYHYKNQSADTDQNRNEAMGLSGFPQCAYTTDVYKMYLADGANSRNVQMLGGALEMGIGGASKAAAAYQTTGSGWGAFGAGLLGMLPGASKILGMVAKKEDVKTLPNQAYGASSNVSSFAIGMRDFSFANMRISGEYAKVIDDYLSMFGYQVNVVKVPNLTGRQSWNYVQLVDGNITGSIPVDDIAKIRGIFETGLRLWHTTDLGNYSLPNNIVG